MAKKKTNQYTFRNPNSFDPQWIKDSTKNDVGDPRSHFQNNAAPTKGQNFRETYEKWGEAGRNQQRLLDAYPEYWNKTEDISGDQKHQNNSAAFKANSAISNTTSFDDPWGDGNFQDWVANASVNELSKAYGAAKQYGQEARIINPLKRAGREDIVERLNNESMDIQGINKSKIENPSLPSGSSWEIEEEKAKRNRLLSKKSNQIDPNAITADVNTVSDVQGSDASTYNASQIGDQTPKMEAAQGEVTDQAIVEAAQQNGVSPEYQAAIEQAKSEMVDFELDKRATVQEQYKNLMDFQPGDTPGWAKASIMEAEQRMAARGMGSSSMAAGEIHAATMRAALPIAQQDARAFQTMSLEKFNKRSQAALMKASHLAQLDMQNLNNRQQSAVVNARSFLQMDMQNLNNRQQQAVINTQSRLQTLMSDQAAQNAEKQFNAQSENDMNMFYDNLQTQIDTFNAAQQNDLEQFNSKVKNQRQQFNTKNGILIERSNKEYLRGITTRNTQQQNQANYVNSQNILDISNTALQNEIQLLRDEAAYEFEMGENAKERALTRWVTSVNNDFKKGLFDAQNEMALWNSVGSAATDIALGAIDSGAVGDAIDWGGDLFGGGNRVSLFDDPGLEDFAENGFGTTIEEF